MNQTSRQPRWLPARRTLIALVAALGVIAAAVSATNYLHHHPASAVVNRTAAETQLIPGLKIFTDPGGTGKTVGTTSADTKPVCKVAGGTTVGVTDPVLTAPGFVVIPGSTNSVPGLPDCATTPGFISTATPGTSGNCPQYDYRCEQKQADESCQLTAEQQQALADQAMARQAELEQLYEQLFYRALAEQAAAKTGSALLQQWLTGHTRATPQDIADLIEQSAITPLDAALAATQAISDLDGQTDRYAGTGCVDGPDNKPGSGQVSRSDSDSGAKKGGGGPASHTLDEVNPEAADTSVDMSLIKPQDYVVRKDDKLLYREDDRDTDTIFSESFRPKDTGPTGQYDLAEKVGGNQDGPYVSTTYDRGWVPGTTHPGQAETYLYVVDAPGGIDMNATLGARAYTGEMEVDFPGGIKTENIIGAYVYERDGTPVMVTDPDGNPVQRFIPNPKYSGTRVVGP